MRLEVSHGDPWLFLMHAAAAAAAAAAAFHHIYEAQHLRLSLLP